MQEESAQDHAAKPKRWQKPLIVVLSIVAVGAAIWSQLPRGFYPTDLSLVGNGRPAVVLAYDPNFGGGMAAMELMNVIRSDYEDRVQFLIARFGLPEGRAFANRHRAVDGTILLFAGDGTRVNSVHLPESEEQLRHVLDISFPP